MQLVCGDKAYSSWSLRAWLPLRIAAGAGGFDEININVECPSEVVSGRNCYGAALMKEPTLVQQLAAAVRGVVPSTTAVTVKHRLGVDEHDSWEKLREFVELVSAPPASVRHFIVHARKAILGLTTAGNRDIPPLRHEWLQGTHPNILENRSGRNPVSLYR